MNRAWPSDQEQELAVARGNATARLFLWTLPMVVGATVLLMSGNDASGGLTLFIAPLLAIAVTLALARFVYRRSGVKPRVDLVVIASVAAAALTEVATIGVALLLGGG